MNNARALRPLCVVFFAPFVGADLFSSAAEAGPSDIVKMYTPQGALVSINNRLESNRPDAPYRLELVAAHYNNGNRALLSFHICVRCAKHICHTDQVEFNHVDLPLCVVTQDSCRNICSTSSRTSITGNCV